jgi:hypothetical protein
MGTIKVTVVCKKGRRKEEPLGDFDLEAAMARLESFDVRTYIPDAKDGDQIGIWFQANADRGIMITAFANEEFGVFFRVPETKKMLGLIPVSKITEWVNAWPLTRAEAMFMARFILSSDVKNIAHWVQNNLLLMQAPSAS